MHLIVTSLLQLNQEIQSWIRGWYLYLERRVRKAAVRFEKQKNFLVDLLLARRGTYQRPFLHLSWGVLLISGFLSAPAIASSYPGALPSNLSDYTPSSAVLISFDANEYGVQTQISEKPRDQVISYTVAAGDTLGTIAEKFGVSIDTIKWANDMRADRLSIGDALKIPPVTGIVHKVREGDTIYTIAKKYKTDAQKILNFPFNDFADLDTFALNVGQTLIVPDGVQVQAPSIIIPAAPVFAGGTGQFLWPAGGAVTQYPIWYHNALDIANPAAPGIASADSGRVVLVEYLRYGYGQHIIVDHGGGLSTLYAHLQEIYVKVGDSVARGQIIGRMGSTGRSTGTHLHFEVRKGGVIVNPLPFLK